MSLLFNMLSRLVITFLLRKCLFTSWLQSPSAVILEPKNIKSDTVSPSICHEVKVESEKVGLKLNIQITKIMASGPITSWELDGETVETVSDFIFWGSKITAEIGRAHV